MELAFGLTSFVASVAIILFTLWLARNELEKSLSTTDLGTKVWKVMPWNLLALILGIAGVMNLLGPIYLIINDWFITVSGVSSLLGLLLSFLLIATGLFGSTLLITKFLSIKSVWVKLAMNSICAMLSVAYFLVTFEIVTETMHYLIAISSAITLVVFFFAVKYWKQGVKENSMLYIGYAFLITMVCTIRWVLIGIPVYYNIIGTSAVIAPIAFFHIGLMVITHVLAKEKAPRKMISFKMIFSGVIVTVIFMAMITSLQLFGYINKYKLEVTRAVNLAHYHKAEINQRTSLGTEYEGLTFSAAKNKLAKGVEEQDKKSIEWAEKSLELHYSNLEKIKEAQSNNLLPKALAGFGRDFKTVAAYLWPGNWSEDNGKPPEKKKELQKIAEFEFTGRGKNDQGENKVTCGVNYNSNDILIFVGESNKIDVMVNTEFLNKESSKTTLKLPASHKKGYSIRHRAEKDFPYSVQVWRMIPIS